jgi:hypothetical protein
LPRRPTYTICPADRVEVEVVEPDGGRALVIGRAGRAGLGLRALGPPVPGSSNRGFLY